MVTTLLVPLVSCILGLGAPPLQGPLPTADLDLGSSTARIRVSNGPPGEPLAFAWGTELLDTPRVIPWLTGLLEVDVSSGEIVRNLVLDANGELDLSFDSHSFEMGETVYLQAATLPVGGGAAISGLASDHVPMADAAYLNPDPDPDFRVDHAVGEVVSLPDGDLRLFFNVPGAMGSGPSIESATSTDGLTFVNDPGSRISSPSGNFTVGDAAPLPLPDGRLRLYYVLQETSGSVSTEVIRSAVSDDWLNFVDEAGIRWAGHADDGGRLGDPDLLDFGDGVVRLYYQGDLSGNNTTCVALSVDGGLTFTREATDILGLQSGGSSAQHSEADALRLPDGRVRILAALGGQGLHSFTSSDGVSFTPSGGGEAILEATDLVPVATSLANPAQLLLDDGTIRVYYDTDDHSIRSALTPDETGRGFDCPGVFLCDHDIVFATSPNGAVWTYGGVYLEGASVPAPMVVSDGRRMVWFVDGTTAAEHLGVFRVDEGGEVKDVRAVEVVGGPGSGLLDPAPVEHEGQTYLYCTVLPFATGGIGRGSVNEAGNVMDWEGLVIDASQNFVDPDVVIDEFGTWHMWAFSSVDALTWHLTSTDGVSWSGVEAVSDLQHRGFSRPFLRGSQWWLHTFVQFATTFPNDVVLYRSANLEDWTLVNSSVYQDPLGRELTDTQVVGDGSGGFLLIHKVD